MDFQERYFLRRGRGKAVRALGVILRSAGSDFYAAYHHYDGPKQRCWAHLFISRTWWRCEPRVSSMCQVYVEARSFPQARTAQLAWERALLVSEAGSAAVFRRIGALVFVG